LVAQYNCIACHNIEGRGGWIQGTLAPEKAYMAPPSLQGAGGKIQGDWLFRFLNRPTTVRPWLKIRMPSFNLTDQEFNDIIRYFQALDGVNLSFEDLSKVQISAKSVQQGHALFTSNACLSCHIIGGIPAGMTEARKASLAPNLKLARERLRYEWIDDWLAEPNRIVPGTKMPAFWDATTHSTFEELAALQKELGAAKTDDERAGIQKDIDAINQRILEAHQQINAVRDYLYSL
jgi:mono/diheme cytochrome c family protein